MSLKFESLEDNMFKNEQIEKNQMQKITGGQIGTTCKSMQTYVMQNGDHCGGLDTSEGGPIHWTQPIANF